MQFIECTNSPFAPGGHTSEGTPCPAGNDEKSKYSYGLLVLISFDFPTYFLLKLFNVGLMFGVMF